MGKNGRLVTRAMFNAKDREAEVCPFVRDSLDRDLFWLEESCETSEIGIEMLLRNQIDQFVSTPPAHDPETNLQPAGEPELWKTFVTIFPDVLPAIPLGQFVNAIHARGKPHFVRKGLMLGEFFMGNLQEGIHSKHFRPNAAPLSLFIIRYMIRSDRMFNQKPEHLAEYNRYFPG